MDIQSEKLELIKLLIATNDLAITKAIRAVFEDSKKVLWEQLTPDQQEEINIGIQNENHGDVVDF